MVLPTSRKLMTPSRVGEKGSSTAMVGACCGLCEVFGDTCDGGEIVGPWMGMMDAGSGLRLVHPALKVSKVL